MNQRTVRIFLSSTFRDFGEERDLLVKQVFPALRAKLRDRFVELVDVDLRWGITVEQAERGEVLPICLAEIDRARPTEIDSARPFFIGMLGDRYGWIPSAKGFAPDLIERQPWLKKHLGGKSVTELEILHGVLNNDRMKGRAFFYFRSSVYARAKGGDYEHASTEDRQRQQGLKRRIKASSYPVTTYRNPQALAKRIEHDLWKLLDTEFPSSSVPDAFEREAMRHEAYAVPRRRLYLGGERYQAALSKALASAKQRILIEGDSGSGKSALLANFFEHYRKQHPNHHILEHYLGASADAGDPYALVRRICEFIKRQTGSSQEIFGDPQKLMDSLPQWLDMVSAWTQEHKTQFVFVLDALNLLNDLQHLRWWPVLLPKGVLVVVSCLKSSMLDALKEKTDAMHGWMTIRVKPLTRAQSVELLITYLAHFNKRLLESMVEKVQTHVLAVNPLFVRTLAEELRLFGVHEELQERLDHYLKSQTIDSFFEKVLLRVEKDCGSRLVRDALTAIWASRAGLTEPELFVILRSHVVSRSADAKSKHVIQVPTSLPPALWAPIRNSLDEMLLETNGRITFAHDYLRKAVHDRYILNSRREHRAREVLQRAFEHMPVNWRTVEELPWQLLQLGKRRVLESYLVRPEVFLEMLSSRQEDLTRYWNFLGQELIAPAYGRRYEKSKSQWDEKFPAFAMELASFLLSNGIFVIFTEELLSEVVMRKPRGVDAIRFLAFRLDYCDFFLQYGDSRVEPIVRNALSWAHKRLPLMHPDRIRVEATHNRCLAAAGNAATAVERQKTLVDQLLSDAEHSDPNSIVDQVVVFAHLVGGYWIERAEPYLVRAIEIAKKRLGSNHRSTLECEDILIKILMAREDYAQAAIVAQDILVRGCRVFGDAHPFTAMVIGKLGICQLHLGEVQSAITSLENATEKLTARFSDEHEYVAMFVEPLADAYTRAGRSDDADRVSRLSNIPMFSRLIRVAND